MTTQVQTSEGTEVNAHYCYVTSPNYNKSRKDYRVSDFRESVLQRVVTVSYCIKIALKVFIQNFLRMFL